MSKIAQSPSYKSLIEMGCDSHLSQAAIMKLKTQDLSQLLDWISAHTGEQEQWKKWCQENKDESEPAPKTISHLVNQEMTQEIVGMGFSKNVAEKSLLMSNNTSVQSALAWIEAHKYDPDFEEQLFLEGQAFQQSSLTEEQAKQRLKQLTEKAREVRKKREEEEERQRQKNRMRYGKEMIEAKRIAEEQAVKRQLQLDRIQKQKDADYKAKLVEQMRRQRNEKLGIKDDGPSQTVSKPGKVQQKPQLSMLQQFQVQCEQVAVGMHAYPQKAKVLFQTVQIYVTNIVKNNGQQKFRKINKQNKAFKSRIQECFGGVQLLEVLGYKDDNGFLTMHNYDLGTLSKALDIIGRYKQRY